MLIVHSIKQEWKQKNAGELKESRLTMFKELLALSEQCERKNQWVKNKMRIPSEYLQKRIEDVIRYRFYDRLDLYDVYRWLDNFSDDEQEMAVSVFEKLEYYREEDLLGILASKLKTILSDIRAEINKAVHLRFMPLGKPGKSGHAIQYLVKNLLKNEPPKNVKTVTFYSRPQELDPQTMIDEDVVIFLDDIIGSGDTFETAANLTVSKIKKKGEKVEILNDWNIGTIVKEDVPYKIILLSCFLMDRGKTKLVKKYPYMRIYGEERVHAFSKSNSPFGGYLKMKQVREFCHKYGARICPRGELGYSNSQALLLFAHAIPNNTLPIIWVDEYEEGGVKKYWHPLIPRNQMKKQNMAFIQRMDNNRWVFKLSQFFGVDLDDPDWKGVIQDKNVKLTYMLRCLEKNISEIVIANDMGLTHDDMAVLFDEGEKLGLWDKDHKVTPDAQKALEEASKLFRIEKKQEPENKVADDRNYMYIPETFRGKS